MVRTESATETETAVESNGNGKPADEYDRLILGDAKTGAAA